MILLNSDSCEEYDVRLNGGGLVEVCLNEGWGLVCAHLNSWTTEGASVVCKQVGLLSRC